MLVILIFCSVPTLFLILSQVFSNVDLYEREILFASLSMLTILNLILCETDKTLLGVIFLFVQSNSELY